MATNYSEILDYGITSHNRLAYFVQRYKIQPVKAERLGLMLGDYMLGQAPENKLCFRCDLDLDALNISETNGHFHHSKCPKEASQNVQLKFR